MSIDYTIKKPSPEEMHRIKQREQYKTMLISLQSLANILPCISFDNKTRTKKMILTQCARYIQYLQLLIWKYSINSNISSSEALKNLVWEGQFLSDEVLENLDYIHKLSSEEKSKFSIGQISDDSMRFKNRQKSVKFLRNPIKTENVNESGHNNQTCSNTFDAIIDNPTLKQETWFAGTTSGQSKINVVNSDVKNKADVPMNKFSMNGSWLKSVKKEKLVKTSDPRSERLKSLSLFTGAPNSSKKLNKPTTPQKVISASEMLAGLSPVPFGSIHSCKWEDVCLKPDDPWMPRPVYMEDDSFVHCSLLLENPQLVHQNPILKNSDDFSPYCSYR